jgi:hypothetical protein
MDTKAAIGQIARRTISRCEELEFKGKARDKECMAVFVGAAMAAEIAGLSDLESHLGKVCVFIVSLRGFQGVKELATWE